MYAVIEQLTLHGSFPLASLCESLEVSRAGYYAWRSESQSTQEQRDRELMPLFATSSGNTNAAMVPGGSPSSWELKASRAASIAWQNS